MLSMKERFSKALTAIEYPKEKTSWNIGGIIKGKNAFYRFDVKEMFKGDWKLHRSEAGTYQLEQV